MSFGLIFFVYVKQCIATYIEDFIVTFHHSKAAQLQSLQSQPINSTSRHILPITIFLTKDAWFQESQLEDLPSLATRGTCVLSSTEAPQVLKSVLLLKLSPYMRMPFCATMAHMSRQEMSCARREPSLCSSSLAGCFIWNVPSS